MSSTTIEIDSLALTVERIIAQNQLALDEYEETTSSPVSAGKDMTDAAELFG